MRVVPTTGRSVVSKACGKSSRRWFSWQFSRATSPGGLRGSISIHLPPVAGATGCHCVGPPGLEQVANNLCCSNTPHVYPPHQPRRAAVAHAGAVRPRGDRRRRIPILSHRWLSPPAVTVPALRAWIAMRATSVAATHLMFTHHTSPGGAALPHAGADRPRGGRRKRVPSYPTGGCRHRLSLCRPSGPGRNESGFGSGVFTVGPSWS
jgi:hypothetical protein